MIAYPLDKSKTLQIIKHDPFTGTVLIQAQAKNVDITSEGIKSLYGSMSAMWICRIEQLMTKAEKRALRYARRKNNKDLEKKVLADVTARLTNKENNI